MTMNSEMQLRHVVGFEHLYAVSDDGRVFTMPHTTIRSDGARVPVRARERKQVSAQNGYKQVMLHGGMGHRVTCYVHRLVAEAFIHRLSDDLVVNHKDGNKANNRADNLEWVSFSENNAHKYRVLNQPHPMTGVRGADCKYSMAVQGCDPVSGAVVVEFAAMKDAGRAGYKAPAICRCVKSETRTHRGLRWRLANRSTTPSASGGHPGKTPGCMPPEPRQIPYGQAAAQ
jgi:hypothetical protein